MRSSRMSRWAAVGSMAALLFFQPGHVSARQAGPDLPGDDESMREDLQETVEIYMIAKMKRFLDLTDDQERKVIPAVEELNNSRRQMMKKRRLTLMKLMPLVEEDAGDDAETARLLDQLDALDRDFRQEEIKARDTIRAALTPRQQARFVVFQERFRHEMQERLRRMGPGGGPSPGEGRPPGPLGQRRIPPPGRP